MPELISVRDHIAWSYANLARAHAALEQGRTKYTRTDHMIRARLFKGLRTGSMAMGSIFDDERLKIRQAGACAYCGSGFRLGLDHLNPRASGGGDDGANLVVACRSCNSSKGSRDLLVWYDAQQAFPPLMVLRRYMKIMALYFDSRNWLDIVVADLPSGLPFDVTSLPVEFPPLSELRL